MNANEKKALITRLIGASRSPFDESDRKMLEGMDDKKLTSLMSAYEGESEREETKEETTTEKKTPTTPDTTTNTTTPSQGATTDQGSVSASGANQVVLSREEYADIKAAATAHKTRMAEERNLLISSLKSAQSSFTEADLNEMTTTQLEKLAITLKVDEPTVDYSVRGRSESRVNSGAPTMRELPDTWGLNKTN